MKLKSWLKWKGIKPSRLAKDLGIHPSYISHLTGNSPRRCPPDMAEKIQKLTDGNVSREELVWPE